MKKQLIAAAVAAAVAAPVFAQNVTLYGRLDAGYRDTEVKPSNSNNKTTTSGIGYSAFTTSRLGITGTEDLGGGLKASFTVEGNIAAAPGTTGSNNATAFNFGRHQFMTLSGGFGTLLVGKTDSMVKSVFDAFDAGYSNNLTGAFDSLAGGTGIVGNRRDTTIRYTAPAFSGVNLSVGLLNSTVKVDGQDSKTEDNNGYELGLRYAAGPLALAAAYRDATSKNPSAAAVAATCVVTVPGGAGGTYTVTPAGCNTGTAAVNRADTDVKTTALGASYNLGAAIVYGQYFDQTDKNKISGAKTDLDAFAIGVRVPMGASTLFASYTDGESKAGAVKTDLKGFQAGIKYDLSKRTYGYVAYGDREEKAGAAKAETKDFAIGIAHHF
jgi:predicted porin